MFKRIGNLLRIAGLVLLLCICSGVTVLQASNPITKMITITDHTGKEVTIPAKLNRIAIDQVPLLSTYVMYHGGSAPYLVGMSGSVLASASKTVLVNIAPEIKNVSTAHYDKGDLNVEQLLTLNPDVVFYNAGNTARGELLANAGIPAVGFSTNGDPTKLYADWLRLLEKVFQQSGRMNDVINYGNRLIDDVAKRTAAIPNDKRKKMLILFNYDKGDIRVSGSRRHFGHHWLKTVNVHNVAENLHGIAVVNLEQIYKWQPELIVMPGEGQCRITPSKVINNTVEGADFRPLKAARDGKVYSNELGMWSWYTPNSDAPLVVLWLAKLAYPELFANTDLKKKTFEYYRHFYHYDLSAAQIEAIYQGVIINK